MANSSRYPGIFIIALPFKEVFKHKHELLYSTLKSVGASIPADLRRSLASRFTPRPLFVFVLYF